MDHRLIPPSALNREGRGGGNIPKQGGIILLLPLCDCSPSVPLNYKYKLCWPLLARLWMEGDRKVGEAAPAFMS